jgi:archaellum biogenesis ATPase FlaH
MISIIIIVKNDEGVENTLKRLIQIKKSESAEVIVVDSLGKKRLNFIRKTADPLDVFNYNKDYSNKRRIISTDIVGVAEEVRENNCRIIINPKDSKDLAEAIVKILKNSKLAKKMGGNGRRLVENKYSWEQIMERIEQVYKEACI